MDDARGRESRSPGAEAGGAACGDFSLAQKPRYDVCDPWADLRSRGPSALCYGGRVAGTRQGRLFEKLGALLLPMSDYAVFGSGPLVAHGLLEEARDVDVVARGAAWERATELGPVLAAAEGDPPVVRLESGAIEIFGGWLGWDIDAIIESAELVDGLPFARLEDVLAFKRAHGRPKDLEHARLLEAYLRDETP